LPLVIFLDANLPMKRRDYVREGMWRLELMTMVDRLKNRESTPESPHEFSFLCLTNYAWYYDGGDDALSTAAQFCWPNHSRHALSEDQGLELMHAVNAYPVVPRGAVST
jgi:hypothetical protein